MNIHFFLHLKLEIALAIPASNEGKIDRVSEVGQPASTREGSLMTPWRMWPTSAGQRTIPLKILK